ALLRPARHHHRPTLSTLAHSQSAVEPQSALAHFQAVALLTALDKEGTDTGLEQVARVRGTERLPRQDQGRQQQQAPGQAQQHVHCSPGRGRPHSTRTARGVIPTGPLPDLPWQAVVGRRRTRGKIPAGASRLEFTMQRLLFLLTVLLATSSASAAAEKA